MDSKNLFHTRATFNLTRLDYSIGLIVLSSLVLMHAAEVDWLRFVIAFWWIDVLGYLPGAIYFRVKGTAAPIPVAYPLLYNVTHSFATTTVVILVWRYVTGEYEWAMLAMPIHLLGDRGLFGNIYKPFALTFEPTDHPLFQRFALDFQRTTS